MRVAQSLDGAPSNGVSAFTPLDHSYSVGGGLARDPMPNPPAWAEAIAADLQVAHRVASPFSQLP
jgi:hypothetical protein